MFLLEEFMKIKNTICSLLMIAIFFLISLPATTAEHQSPYIVKYFAAEIQKVQAATTAEKVVPKEDSTHNDVSSEKEEVVPAPTPEEIVSPKEEPPETVVEKPPTVTAIVVEGNSNIPAQDILNILSCKIGELALEPKIIRDQNAIYEMGYFSDVTFLQEPFAGGVKIIFRVLEYPIIEKIEITGNKIVPTDKIRSLIETKEGEILNIKTLHADKIGIDNYYNETLGYYLRPHHVIDLSWTPEGQLTIKIQEALTIKEIEIKGNTIFSKDQLLKLMKTQTGDFLQRKVLESDLNKIADFYKEKDYLANIELPQVNFKTGVIILNIDVLVAESIRIEGNKKTKTYFIKRMLTIKPGTVLRERKIRRDTERLRSLSIFEDIEPALEAGSAPGKVILVWKLKEAKKFGFFTFGLGYGDQGVGATSRKGLSGSISASTANLGHRGQSAAIRWDRGYSVDSIAISFFDPAINDRTDSLGFSVFRSTYKYLRQPVYNTDPVQYAYYDTHRSGGSVSFGRYLTDDLKGILSVRREKFSLTQTPESVYVPMGTTIGTSTLNAVSLDGIYDTRDNILDPQDGYLVDASGQFTGGIFKGSYRYNKYQFQVRKYFPLKRERCIALRLWGGAIQGAAPATEYFYIGGTDTIRAFEDNSLFGTRMVLGNLEFRFPITKNIKYLKGAIFTDAGNAWIPGEYSGLYKDVGAGIRLVFPKMGMGIIRVDYAVGSKNKNRISIGIGQNF